MIFLLWTSDCISNEKIIVKEGNLVGAFLTKGQAERYYEDKKEEIGVFFVIEPIELMDYKKI